MSCKITFVYCFWLMGLLAGCAQKNYQVFPGSDPDPVPRSPFQKILKNEGKWLGQDNVEGLIEEYKKLAIKGNLEAMERLGYLYAPMHATLGGRMPNDYQKGASLQWYSRAATLGHLEAIRQVAEYFENGVDCEKNEQTAFQWYQQGYLKSPQSFALKMFHLYREGIGCEKDLKKADAFFLEAKDAAQKNGGLAYNLGSSYQMGSNGLPKDIAEAKYWFKTAIKLGAVYAELDLKLIDGF